VGYHENNKKTMSSMSNLMLRKGELFTKSPTWGWVARVYKRDPQTEHSILTPSRTLKSDTSRSELHCLRTKPSYSKIEHRLCAHLKKRIVIPSAFSASISIYHTNRICANQNRSYNIAISHIVISQRRGNLLSLYEYCLQAWRVPGIKKEK
jgi:hypothetical protein